MINRIVLLLVAAVATPAAAQHQVGGTPPFVASPQSRDALDMTYWKEARDLRDEMRVQQKADGGALTTAHRAEIDGKLQALLASYERDFEQVDPFSVNADGSRAYRRIRAVRP